MSPEGDPLDYLRESTIAEVPVERRTRLWARVACAVSAAAAPVHASAGAPMRPLGSPSSAASLGRWRGAVSTFARWSAPALVAGIAIGATGQAKLTRKTVGGGDEPLDARVTSSAAAVRRETGSAESVPGPEQRVASAAPTDPTSAAPPAFPAGSSRAIALGRERALLDRAQASLSAGEPARALELVERHLRRYSQGALSEEREALAVNALVTLGRYREAVRRGAAFRARYPHSLLMPSIDAALAAVPEQ